jgi:hypothetical protein
VSENLRSLEELQLMMAVVQAEHRWWDASAASAELGMDVVTAGRVLDRLATLNLFDIRITGDVRYQFKPGTDELAEIARECLEAYRSNPLALVTAVQRPARKGIRDFADAFRLRRHKDPNESR